MVSGPENNVMEVAAGLRRRARDLARAGEVSKATELLRSAVQLEPDHLPSRVNLGASLQSMGQHAEALDQYDHALTLDRTRPEVFSNRSLCLVGLGRISEAIESAHAALQLRLEYPEALNNLGAAYHALGDLSRASKYFRDAIKLRPDYAKALANLGFSLQGLGLIEEALQEMREAFDKDPSIEGLQGAILHLRMQVCDWDRIDVDRDRLLQAIKRGERVAEPFVTLGLVDDPAVHRQAAVIARRSYRRSLDVQRWDRKAMASGLIKVGYFSSDFSNHATTHLLRDLIRMHNRSVVEVIGFSLAVKTDDLEGRRIRDAFDKMVDLHGIDDDSAVTLIRKMGINIAIDLKGYTQNSRPSLFERRVAPIQVGFLGYPGTTASPTMDYLIADRVVVPSSERRYYDEKIVFFPGSYQVNTELTSCETQVVSRANCSLPPTGIVFCCFNNTYKITPEVFTRWMRILKAVPDSVLWLLGDNRVATRNLKARAASEGVDPARLIFAARAPVEEHHMRHRLADIFLDTSPYNAHTTASDALRVGVPIVTLPGRSFQSRVAASLLEAIGAHDLVAKTPDEYEQLAIDLAKNRVALDTLKRRVADCVKISTLFQPSVFARHLEKAFMTMVGRETRGLPPADIQI